MCFGGALRKFEEVLKRAGEDKRSFEEARGGAGACP